uniref:glucuronosyltransferase n=1 Tax=Panagrolaimus davidi TaxID=227884 RepID=A0A914PLJ4_9BILA
MNDEENLAKLKAENFDLGITESFESCGLGVFKKLGIKKHITAFASALFPKVSLLLGIKVNPSYIPGMLSKSTDEMTFSQRITNFCYYLLENWWMGSWSTKGIQEVVQKQFPDFNLEVS